MEHVVVLMSTYNGELYIQEQIESILAQKDVEVELIVRDDGSTDDTIDILNNYKDCNKLTWYSGDNLGAAKSFMDLIYNSPNAGYYAFCDQDDIWLKDKLAIAISKLKEFDFSLPMLYYGRPRLVDANGNLLDAMASSDKMFTFGGSIINSNCTGCTMVFNRTLMEIVKKHRPKYVSMHDSWVHKVCIIHHGILVYDEDVHILYRQHGNNVIGVTNSFIGRIKKHINSFRNRECSRSKIIISLLDCYSSDMSEEDRQCANLVSSYKASFVDTIKLMMCKEICTESKKRNFLFKIAVLLRIF